jgi:parallel beta helix pectate lyase-like protein/dockerin type I repeat protein
MSGACTRSRRGLAILCVLLGGWGAFLIASPAAGATPTFYVSPDGNDANPGTEAQPWLTIQKAANTLAAGQRVLIMEGTYRDNVVMTRDGSPSQPITFANYPGHAPVIDGTDWTGTGGLFHLDNAAYVTLSGLSLINAARSNQSAIRAEHTQGLTIENCYTYNSASSGAKIRYCSDLVIRGNEFEQACLTGDEETITITRGTHNVLIEGNYLHDCQKEGVDIKHGSYDVQVLGNTIVNQASQGLYADSWDDPTWNILYARNVILDSGMGLGVSAEQGGLLSDVRFENNVVSNTTGPGMFVSDWGGGETHPIDGVTFVNNTVSNAGTDWGAGMYVGNTEAENIVVRNNLFHGDDTRLVWIKRAPVSMTLEYNLYDGRDGLMNTGCLEGEAGFVDAGSDDFHLLATSDAIDAGTSTDAPLTDLDGNPRPLSTAWDMGAYEYPAASPGGDFNHDGQVNAADIDLLHAKIILGTNPIPFDLNSDGMVDVQDADYLIGTILGTSRGDANLDGQVSDADYTLWADNYLDPAGWAGGDFNGDRDVTDADYTLWADNYAPAGTAPEPTALLLSAAGWLAICRRARRNGRTRTAPSTRA